MIDRPPLSGFICRQVAWRWNPCQLLRSLRRTWLARASDTPNSMLATHACLDQTLLGFLPLRLYCDVHGGATLLPLVPPLRLPFPRPGLLHRQKEIRPARGFLRRKVDPTAHLATTNEVNRDEKMLCKRWRGGQVSQVRSKQRSSWQEFHGQAT